MNQKQSIYNELLAIQKWEFIPCLAYVAYGLP